MELSEIQNRVAELEQQISNLPVGSITKKTVNGKEYFYHRWTEDKKRKEKYIPVDELENFHAQIEQRKKLDQDLKALKKQLPKTRSMDASMFTTMSAPEKHCVLSRNLSEATADVSVSSNCVIMSMVIHRIKYSFFTVCAGQEKPP